VLAASPARAQDRDWSKIEVKTTDLGGGVSALAGAGGNIGVFVSPDGILLVDDQFAPLTPKIKAAVAALSDKPVRLVLNTHWHGDHVGGNENLAKDGA
jgi:glyoxylase-like metal-dependent hydrolase (beta-lactamase superfamily II)